MNIDEDLAFALADAKMLREWIARERDEMEPDAETRAKICVERWRLYRGSDDNLIARVTELVRRAFADGRRAPPLPALPDITRDIVEGH